MKKEFLIGYYIKVSKHYFEDIVIRDENCLFSCAELCTIKENYCKQYGHKIKKQTKKILDSDNILLRNYEDSLNIERYNLYDTNYKNSEYIIFHLQYCFSCRFSDYIEVTFQNFISTDYTAINSEYTFPINEITDNLLLYNYEYRSLLELLEKVTNNNCKINFGLFTITT